ncbi:hypothetical protein PG993_002200 [Apiospora rasikravindrae]|uniref:Uncharacterized protein n=1 Tax=Apiospora rasikravindrae TaxID=990691 RepID=A0ABR1UGD1_9PEZI
MAGRTSTDSSVPDLPPHAEVATDLTGVNRLPEPPTEIPPSPPKLQKEASAERVLIWRAEVNASTPTCACSLMTRRQPVTAWCPECAGPFEGLQYTRFKDGEGLTRFPSGRRSIANVWAIFSPRDSDPGNLPRLAPRGTDHLFSVNEFAVYGRRLLHKTKLDRVFGGGSKKRERERYARPEYGDLPGSVAEMEPEYDPPEDPAALMGPNAAYDSPALDARMRRQPPRSWARSIRRCTAPYGQARSSTGTIARQSPPCSMSGVAVVVMMTVVNVVSRS